MKNILLLFSGILFMAFALLQEQFEIKSFEMEAFEASNAFRAQHRRDTLTLDTFLCQLAREHSKNMASGKVGFGHQGFRQRCEEIKKKRTSYAQAENVYYSSWVSNGKEAVDSWIHSKEHRQNLLGKSYHRMGIGMASGKKGTFYTQIFSD